MKKEKDIKRIGEEGRATFYDLEVAIFLFCVSDLVSRQPSL